MAQTYEQAIEEGRRLYNEAMDKAAAFALFITDEYGRPLQTVCKEIAGEDGWQALRSRAQRVAKSQVSAGSDALGAAPWTQDPSRVRSARNVLRDPEAVRQVIASLPEDAVRNVAVEASRRAAANHEAPERIAVPKPTVGPDQTYQDAAAEIIYREADRRAGRWTPDERTEAIRHFLIRALTDAAPLDTDHLMDEITAYLQEVAS